MVRHHMAPVPRTPTAHPRSLQGAREFGHRNAVVPGVPPLITILLIAALAPAAAAGERPSAPAEHTRRITGRIDLFPDGQIAHWRGEPAPRTPARSDRPRTADHRPADATPADRFIERRFSSRQR